MSPSNEHQDTILLLTSYWQQHKCTTDGQALEGDTTLEKTTNHVLPATCTCSLATILAYGRRIAADYEFEIIVDGVYADTLYMSPTYLDDAVVGLQLRDGKAKLGDHAVIERIERIGPLKYRLRARLVEAKTAVEPPQDGVVDWHIVESLYKSFTSKVSKRVCPYAVHAVAVYTIDEHNRVRDEVLVADVSRHSASLKVAGILSRLAAAGELKGRKLVAMVTGRVSSDLVAAMNAAGVYIIVSNHHPLLSGIYEAIKHGTTLVLRRPDNRGIITYTAAWRLQGAPVIEPRLDEYPPERETMSIKDKVQTTIANAVNIG